MKTQIKLVLTTVFAFLLAIYARSQGYIVPNGVTYAGNIPGVGGTIDVLQNPTNGDYSGFSFPPQGGDTFQFSPFADEGVRVFLLALNDPVSLQAIQTAGYTELLYPNTYTFADGASFYVGLYTGYTPQNGVYTDPMFGWAQLVNNAGVIELLGGALAYQADGIYAGTQNIIQPVPEPSALNLFGLGLLGLGWHLRQRMWRRNSCSPQRTFARRSRSALPITIKSENPIVAAHSTGLMKPSAASGTAATL